MSNVRVQDSRIERHGTAVDADLRAVAAEIGGGNTRKQASQIDGKQNADV